VRVSTSRPSPAAARLNRRATLLLLASLLLAACGGAVTSTTPTTPPPAPSPVAPSSATPSPAPTPTPKAPTAATALREHPPRIRVTQPTPGSEPVGGIAAGPTTRVATRVVVEALGIDLPVMRQRTSYPPCNVAMYLTTLKQPGQGGATYLYAHARSGMFLPLLERSRVNDGASLIGLRVEVYTGDNRRFVYRIDEVRRHATDLRWVQRRRGEALWLQTSEGPRGTIPKLQVGAALLSSGPATHAAAHPVPRPVNCG
jgi:hypothetical protein